jgi:MFS family permease
MMNRHERMIIGLTGCSHSLSHGYLLIFPSVLILLREEFSMGYLGLGVISNIMTFTYGLGALPGGMIYNRLGPKKLYLLCFLGSAFASLLVAFSPNILLFTAGLALLGGLGSVYHPLANSLITHKVREYGRGMGMHGAAGNIGLAIAPFLAGLIASRWGWRYAYLFFAIPGVMLAVWSLFIDMSIPKLDSREASCPKAPSGLGQGKKRLWLFFSLPMILLYLVNMLQSFNYTGATTFLPTYMGKETSFQIFSWDSVAIGGMLSGLALFMGVFGQYFGGVLGQKSHLERNVLIAALICFPSLLYMSFARNLSLLLVALVFFFFNFALQPMCNSLIARYTTLEMRGAAFGIFFFAAFGLGSLASSFSGYLAQTFGLPSVFLGLSGMSIFLVACCYLLFRAKKLDARDLEEGTEARP